MYKRQLIYKAAKLLMDEFSITDGVSVKLDKRIPVAAGMAGGSTDATGIRLSSFTDTPSVIENSSIRSFEMCIRDSLSSALL